MKKKFKNKVALGLVATMFATLISIPTMVSAAETVKNPVVVNEDFDGYQAGTDISTINAQNSLGWTVMDTNEGDSVTVEYDESIGSNAMKIVQKGGSSYSTGIKIPVTQAGDNCIYKVNMKIKRVCASSVINRLLLATSDGWTVSQFVTYGSGCDLYMGSTSNFVATLKKEQYVPLEFIINKAEDKLYVSANGGAHKAYTITNDKFSALNLSINGNMASSSWNLPEEGEYAEYWIDDVSVVLESLKVEGSTPGGNVLKSGENGFSVKFNYEISDECLNDTYFHVTEGGMPVGISVSKDSTDATKVNIKTDVPFKAGNEYLLTVEKNIAAEDSTVIPNSETYLRKFKTVSKNVLADDDFEGYQAGTNLSDVHGDWEVVTAAPGSKVTIENDPVTGSKAVKVTKDFETLVANVIKDKAGFKVNFPAVNSGIAEVSFKLRAEKRSAWLSDTFLRASNNSAVGGITFIQYNQTLYNNPSWSPVFGKIYGDNYTEFKYIIDFDNKSYTLITIPAGRESEKKEWTTTNRTYTDLAFLDFTITAQNNNTAHNSASYIPDAFTNPPSDPVFWIDDIKVERKGVEIISTTPESGEKIGMHSKSASVKFNTKVAEEYIGKDYFELYKDDEKVSEYTVSVNAEDNTVIDIIPVNGFEKDCNYSVKVKGEVAATGYLSLGEDFEFGFTAVSDDIINIISLDFEDGTEGEELAANDNIIVSTPLETDSVTVEADGENNKATKIVVTENTQNAVGFGIKFPEQKSGKLHISFKLKAENNSGLLTNFGIKSKDVGKYRTGFIQYKNDIFEYGSPDGKWQDKQIGILSSSYSTYDYYIDLDDSTFSIDVDGVRMFSDLNFRADSGDNVAQINFMASFNLNTWSVGESFFAGRSGDAIYWVDDVLVEKYYYPEIVEASVANGAKKVSVNSQISYEFDKALNQATLTKDNIKVYCDDLALGNDEYEITYNDKVLNITLTDGILYDSEYKITMSDKIMSEDKYALRYTEYNFTTEIDPEKIFLISVVNDNSVEVEDFSEYRGETINVKAELNAEFPEYTFIAVLKDGDGILVAADIVENDVNAVLSVPDDADANYYVEGLLLDGMDTLSPLAKKQEKKTSLTE